ncbi:MAG: HEAT repeat domain-containing protein, partial [Thermoanaerobaculia bacterium]
TDNSNETDAITFLKSFLGNRDSDIRVFALQKLGDLRGQAGLGIVRDIARSSSDPALKRRAENILNDR